MKHFALVVTLFLGFSLTQMEAQSDPACCSPEWCKIFCGKKATNASTATLKNCKPANCKKVASTTSAAACSPKAVSTASAPACSPKVASTVSTPSCSPKVAATAAVATTVSSTPKVKEACCALLPGCCVKGVHGKVAEKTCSPAKATADKKMALAVKEE